jgi:hypothetical protein
MFGTPLSAAESWAVRDRVSCAAFHVHVVPLYAMADTTAEAFARTQRTSPAAVLVDSYEQICHALAGMEDDDTAV